MKQHFLKAFFVVIAVAVSGLFSPVLASAEGEEFNAGDFIIHHITDAHTIHIIGPVSIPLPIIAIGPNGLDFFSSSNLYNHDTHAEGEIFEASSGAKYFLNHEKLFFLNEGASSPEFDTDNHALNATAVAWNFSITKSIFGFLLGGLIVILLFTSAAKGYKKNKGKAPKGIQSFLEPLVIFIRDEVAVPSLGKKKAARYLPFLLTIFFLIWVLNLLGLIPFIGGFNVTGTMAITIVLAAIVFIITTFSGNKHYWGHIFWPPGVPLPIKIILVPIEFASIFIKPAVLMVRLTANISAGHIIILSFVSLIMIFAKGGEAMGAGIGVGIGAVLFMCFMFLIELLVAFLQAYVFTLLAALYFGDATQDGHH